MRRIENGRLRGREGLWSVGWDEGGRIDRLEPAGARRDGSDGSAIDAAGGLILASFIDLHVHLDLAFSLKLVPTNESGTLAEAIRHWSAAKRTMTAQSVRERAERAIREEAGFGVGYIRTHVDVATAAGLRLCEGVLAAREATRDLVTIEVAAFPQDGIVQDPGAYEQMDEAMKLGCDLVGGIAHNERTEADSRRHIELLFDLAEKHDAGIDCHIDETDDPTSRCTEVLAAKTIERGRQGRVTASHVCALSSYDDAHAAKVIRLLAEAGVHVVTNPGVNLHLQGRYDRYPKRRGVTRVSELMSAGVNVSAGQDCIQDPFYPLGTGNMLEVGHLLIHADHLSRPVDFERVMDCITVNPARAMGLGDYGIEVGKRADLVVLGVSEVGEAFRTRRPPTVVMRGGKVVSTG